MTTLGRAALLTALVTAAWVPAQAATYFIATAGSDTNAGTGAAPFKTIARGVAAAAAGDTIIVRDGTYAFSGSQDAMAVTLDKAGTSSAWITLEAENKWKAILDCRLICHSYLAFGPSSAYWIIRGFDIRGGRSAAIFSNSGGGKNVLIENNRIHHIGNRANSTPYGEMGVYTDKGASGFKIDRNVFHDIGRTSNLTGNKDHGIYSHGGLVITNNVFYNMLNGWHIQTAEGFHGTIANNTFFGPALLGKGGQVLLWGASSELVIRNNIFYGPNTYGIGTLNAPVSGACSIDHNIVYTPGKTVAMIESPAPSGCAVSTNKLNVDPQLVNPVAGGDFHLKMGSPAIDAGAAVPGLTADLDGAPRPAGAAVDVGAYEYGGAAAPPPAPAGCATVAASWRNFAIAAQTRPFTISFDATPSAANIDGVAGLSNGPASGYAALAAAVRFNNAGRIDARSGGSYAAAAPIAYAAGRTHRFRLVVDPVARRYSAYVKQGDAAEQMIGSNLAFRTEQAGVSSLSSLAMFASAGTVTVCPPAVAAAPAPAPAPAAGCESSAGAWQNVSLNPQTGAFSIEFDATPAAAGMDGVIGLSNGPASDYTRLAAAVRFNTAGRIDARNGGSYATAASIPYSARQTYRFRLVIDLAARRYSAYVRQGTGTEQLIGANFAFRTEQASASLLNNLAFFASTGSQTVCKGAVTAAAPASGGLPPVVSPPAACVTSGAAWLNVPLPTQSGSFTVEFDATPAAANIDGVMGLSNGAASGYPQLAAAVRFNNAGRIDARNGGVYAASTAVSYSANVQHRFRLVVDLAAKRYSAYVKAGTAAEQTLGTNLAFRTEQSAVRTLSHLALFTSAGRQTVCGAAVR